MVGLPSEDVILRSLRDCNIMSVYYIPRVRLRKNVREVCEGMQQYLATKSRSVARLTITRPPCTVVSFHYDSQHDHYLRLDLTVPPVNSDLVDRSVVLTHPSSYYSHSLCQICN
jgi:hypothetical protein